MIPFGQVLDLDANEFHDLQADPNKVVKVQGLVRELLEGNPARQLGIKQQIIEDIGQSALPGLISATYVLVDNLKNERQRELLADIIYAVSLDNPSAALLLLKAGIIDNPVWAGQQIIAQVVQRLGLGGLAIEETSFLLKEAVKHAEIDDREVAVILFECLLPLGIGVKEALKVCTDWLKTKYKIDAPVSLISALLNAAPEETENTLSLLLRHIERDNKDRSQTFSSIIEFTTLNTVQGAIRSGSQRLSIERTGRAKPVEFLFMGCIARYIASHEADIEVLDQFINAGNFNSGILRYWWQALSTAVKLKSEGAKRNFEHCLSHLVDQEACLLACIQLLYIVEQDASTKAWARQLLQDVKQSNPALYQNAVDEKAKHKRKDNNHEDDDGTGLSGIR